MHHIRIDPPHQLLEIDVAGELDAAELAALFAEVRSAAAQLDGPVRVLADLRAFRTRPASFGELAGTLQEAGRSAGVERVAEVVADGKLAEALDARTTAAGALLRRFVSPDAARAWLGAERR